MNADRLSRRRFLGTASAAVAAPTIVPSTLFGADAPSNRVGIGAIGLGNRGSGHAKGALRMPGVQVLAVCDVYASKAESMKQQVQRHYAQARAQGTYKGCTSHQDFRELLAREDVDAVFIASPENWHGLHMGMAAKAGKDVYGEKSLTHTIPEGRALVDTVRRYGTVFQAGTQQRSDAKFRLACELARNGYLGKVSEVHVGVTGGKGRPKPGIWPVVPVPADIDYDLWLGPAPWKPHRRHLCTSNWYFVSDYCAGFIASWGVHHVDIAMWGMPELHEGQVEVDGTAKFFNGTADVSYEWDTNMVTNSGLRVHFVDNSKSHGQGCRFIGDEGWVYVNRRSILASDPALLKIKLKPGDTRLQVSNSHPGDFFDRIHDRRDPVAPVEACYRATALSLVANIATRLGRKVTWDWATESFVDDETANRMLGRAMRVPWRM
jgi:predicted dehydrogenase